MSLKNHKPVLLFVLTGFSGDLLDFAWSGNVSSDAVTVVVGIKDHRVATTKNDVAVRVFAEKEMTKPVSTASQILSPSGNHLARFTLSGLQPNTSYYYGVWVDNVQDTVLNDADNGSETYVGQFTTFPVEGSVASFLMAFSCGHGNESWNNPVFTTVKNNNPLFYMCTGDFFYSDSKRDPSGFDPRDYEGVDEFRGWYARALNATEFNATTSASLYRALPIVYIWDDHDFGANNGAGTSGIGAIRKPFSHQAYREYVPHYPLSGEEMHPIYQAFTVGRIRFILSEVRTESDVPSVANTRIGSAQKRWLKEELLKANGTYPIIVWLTTVPWNGEPDSGSDRWQSYSDERAELANFIKDNHIRGFCALSGDMHGVGIDDGTYTDFATGGGAEFPIFQAGSMGSGKSIKAGPYNRGANKGKGQFGLFEVMDNGRSAIAVWTAKNELNEAVVNTEKSSGYPAVGTPIVYAFTNSFPLITSLSPASDAIDVLVGGDLVMTFNEPVQKGAGYVRIHRARDDTEEQAFLVSSNVVVVKGNQMTLHLPANLKSDTRYYVTVDEGAVTDGLFAFPGIYATPELEYKKWGFSTK